jgi:hypothetical protein
MIDHDRQLLSLGQLDELFRLGDRGRERLLDKDVFAVLERPFRQLIVGRDRRDDRDGVDVRRVEDLLAVWVKRMCG